MSVKQLREEVKRLFEAGQYQHCAAALHQLAQLGDHTLGGWEYALKVAAALGDRQGADAALTSLQGHPVALLRSATVAWTKAVEQQHIDLARHLAWHTWQSVPQDANFWVLNLIDTLNTQGGRSERLRQLMARPLPLDPIAPSAVSRLIGAFYNAGYWPHAQRLFQEMLQRHPSPLPELQAQWMTLALDIKLFGHAIAMTKGSLDPRQRYLCALACAQSLQWDQLAQCQLTTPELHSLLVADPTWQPYAPYWAVL